VARWLEQELTKRRILELYLNVIEWGDGIYGAEAAARAWAGKPASTLEPAEAAQLAAMIPNPRRLNPRVNAARTARAQRRVLWLMAQAGYLGRSGMGSEPPPPPEPVEEDDEDLPVPEAEPVPEPVPVPEPKPEPQATPVPTESPGTPAPEPTPPLTPTPTPTPEA
jgi:monofunctional biosynthetic peptidoglycan transglycosylase